MTIIEPYDGRIRANALHIPLADRSVHMCVTSPPYHRLRKYEISPTVWGGDSTCKHRWGTWQEKHDVREIAKDGFKSRTTTRYYGDPSRKFDGNHQKHTAAAACKRCGAMMCQLGMEPTITAYIEHLVSVFDEVHRVLRTDGSLWVNMGDSYSSSGGSGWQGRSSHRAGRGNVMSQMRDGTQRPSDGLKPKNLCGVPWRFALAMQERGWYWRSVIVWNKVNCMPGSMKDRPVSSWEPVFLFSKSQRYFYDHVAVMEATTGNAHSRGNGIGPKTAEADSGIRNNSSFSDAVKDIVLARNRRDVWTIPSEPLNEKHYAAFPQALVEPCILAGTSAHGCCADCGAPYKRLIEKQLSGDMTPEDGQALRDQGVRRTSAESKSKWRALERQASGRRIMDSTQMARDAGADHDHPFLPPRTIGWKKTCRCTTEEIARAIVLDTFAGSGTTLRVAERLDRRWVGLDLGCQDMQKRRLRGIQKPIPGLMPV